MPWVLHSARVFHTITRPLLPISRASPSRFTKVHDARFLSIQSTNTGHVQQQPSEDSQHELDSFSHHVSNRRDFVPTQEMSADSSHFTTSNTESPSFEAAGPKKRRHVLVSKQRKISRRKAKRESGSPGTGKKSRQKLAKDFETISELVRDANGKRDRTMELESWKDSWGEDKLKPSLTEGNFSDYQSRRLPSYDRRIEGLIAHSSKDVLEEIEPPAGRAAIATLAHGLDRVLFNPGVHWVQDPRSRVYNFTPYIKVVPDLKDFSFDRLSPFIRSSRDTVMRDLAMAKGKLFAGSTSSLSGLLCHIYFLLSQNRGIDVNTLPEPFSTAKRDFTPAQRMPTAVVFNHRDGVYLIDSDSTDNDDSQWNVLTWIGTMLEHFFTLPKAGFSKLLHSESPENTFEKQPQAYRYSQSKAFVMRSQLDCFDPRLPGSGVFDIKTRAALPVRMDNLNFKENSGYIINSLHGALNSFDREYYDLIRSAFLKYSFQARIGNMDGIFLAYHNTARVFGFQYVPLEEMDARLFGDYKRRSKDDSPFETGGKDLGWRIFHKCVDMLEVISSEIIECFPGQSVTCLAETSPRTGTLHIWIQPVDEATASERENEEIPIVKTESEKPIIQLDITAQSFLGGMRVSGPDAIFLSRKPWTVHWTISRSSLSDKITRHHLAAAKKRKYRPKAYPTGVNADNLEEFIKNLGFGNPETMPDTRNFIEPDPSIQFLRKISREGRLESERLRLQDEAKGVHVWQPTAWAESAAMPSNADGPITAVKPQDACNTSNNASNSPVDDSVSHL